MCSVYNFNPPQKRIQRGCSLVVPVSVNICPKSVRCPNILSAVRPKLSETWFYPKIVRIVGLNLLNVSIMNMMLDSNCDNSGIFVIWFGSFFTFSIVCHISSYFRNISLRMLSGCPKLSETLSLCPSEFRIGIRTNSEFRNCELRLAPLLHTYRRFICKSLSCMAWTTVVE